VTCPTCDGPTSVIDSRSTIGDAVPVRLKELAQLWGGSNEDWRCRRRQCKNACGAKPVWTVELHVHILHEMLNDAHNDKALADTLGSAS